MIFGRDSHDILVFVPMGADGLPPGDDIVTDFKQGQDRIDLTAFATSFDQIFGHDHSGQHDDGPPGPITAHADGHDMVLSFNAGSIRLQDVSHLTASGFLF
jgi:hypothetical protein